MVYWNNRLDPMDEKVNCQVAGILITTRKGKIQPSEERRNLNENRKAQVV